MEGFGQRIRESRAIADAWIAKFGEQPSGEIGRMVIQMVQTLAFEVVDKLDKQAQGNEAIKPTEILSALNDLALLSQRLEKASELSTRREKELRQAMAAEAEQAVKKAGVSQDTAAAIRAALEGEHV